MTNVTYVSCLYKLNACDDNNVTKMNENIHHLLQSGLRIILFTDDHYYSQLKLLGDTVTVIVKPLQDLTIYRIIMEKEDIKMPTQRHPQKDSRDYMALMNCKPEFMLLAEPHIVTPYAGWLDCGIGKIFTNKQDVFDKLKTYKV